MRMKRLTPVTKFALLLISLATGPIQTVGASPVEEAITKLTGGNSREWVFTQWRRIMGADPTCIAGESYRFSSDKSLLVEECLNGTTSSASKTWSIESSGPLDIVIKIDNEPFILLFNDADDGKFMLLRKSSDSKVTPTVDKKFRQSED